MLEFENQFRIQSQNLLKKSFENAPKKKTKKKSSKIKEK